MKAYVKLLLFVILVAGIAATQASAQRMRMSPDDMTKRLKDSLSLNDEQSAKVLKIYQDMDKQRQEVFNANSGDRDAMRTAMRSMMDDTDKKIEALLTADQKAKYEVMKTQRMQRRQGPPPRND